jgi:hypothetical protein
MHAALPVAAFLLFTPSEPVSAASEWSSLDREIDALAAALEEPPSGPDFFGWIRSRWAMSEDVDASSAAGDQDLGGFNLDSVRLGLSGEIRPGYGYTLSFEAGDALVSDAGGAGGGGTVSLFDAYASIKLGERAGLTVGRFSATVLWNTGVEERRLLFLDRSFLDESWDGRDVGFELTGSAGPFNAWAAIQNGANGAGQDVAFSARASVHLLGDSLYSREGALGLAPDEQHLTLGVGWFDDQALDDGDALGADLVFAKGRWSAVAEIVDHGRDIAPTPSLNPATGAVLPGSASATGAETPWSATVGYLLVPDKWELGLRWQQLDDDADTTAASAAINRYVAGHDAKWTLQLDTIDSDDPALEADTLAVGLTVGF